MPAKLHRGRLIDHIHLRARDLAATRRFYLAVFAVLGIPCEEAKDHLACDEIWIDALDNGTPGQPSHVHMAFQAADQAMVQRFHAAGLAAGGRDNGQPGERPYHPGYYAAFLIDPDGNNIEAVYHGPAQRSAASVEFTLPG